MDAKKLVTPDVLRLKQVCSLMVSAWRSNELINLDFSLSNIMLSSLGDEVKSLTSFQVSHFGENVLVLPSSCFIESILQIPRILIVQFVGRTENIEFYKEEIYMRKKVLKLKSTIQGERGHHWVHFLDKDSNWMSTRDHIRLLTAPIDQNTLFLLYETIDDEDQSKHEESVNLLFIAKEQLKEVIQLHVRHLLEKQEAIEAGLTEGIDEFLWIDCSFISVEDRSQCRKNILRGKPIPEELRVKYLPTIIKEERQNIIKTLEYFKQLDDFYGEMYESRVPLDTQTLKMQYLANVLTRLEPDTIKNQFGIRSQFLTFLNIDGSCFLNVVVTFLLKNDLNKYLDSVDESRHMDFKTAIIDLKSQNKGMGVTSLLQFRRSLGDRFEYSHGGDAATVLKSVLKMIPSLYADTLILQYKSFDDLKAFLAGKIANITRRTLTHIAIVKFVQTARSDGETVLVVIIPKFLKITDNPFQIRLGNIVYDLHMTFFVSKKHVICRVLQGSNWFEATNHRSYFFASRHSHKVFQQGTTVLFYHRT